MKITLIVGLPGSGKTHLAKEIASETGGFLLDDPNTGERNIRDQIKMVPMDCEHLIVTDPHLCKPKQMTLALDFYRGYFPHAMFETVWFENDPEQCLINIEKRADGRKVTSFVERLSQIYLPPESAAIKPVYRDETYKIGL